MPMQKTAKRTRSCYTNESRLDTNESRLAVFHIGIICV